MKVMKLFYYVSLIMVVSLCISQISCNRNAYHEELDQKPKYPGGEEALKSYLEDVEYPDKVKRKFIEGKVFVRFYIDENGSPVDFDITKGTGTILDSAALQHVKNMPQWSPGYKNSEPVKVKRIVTVPFKLQKRDFDFPVEYSENNDFNEENIYKKVEKMPEFPGGQEALNEYLKEINYPDYAQDHGIEGEVYVRFVIDEEGKTTNVSIAKGTKTILDIAALLHVKNMPKWKPGYDDGNLVKVQYVVPIRFRLK